MGEARETGGVRGGDAPDVLLEGSGRHALYPVRVGVLDDRAVRAFTGGQCHALALALYERTHWPLVWVENEEGDPKHCFVIDSSFHAVDIAGAHSRAELVQRWGVRERTVNSEQVLALSGGFGGWRVPRVDVARAFVDEVLLAARAGKEIYPPGPDAVPETDEPTPTPQEFRVVGRDGREHNLLPGVLDERVRLLLRAEQSYALALYLVHELPGGPWRVGLVEFPDARLGAFAVDERAGVAVDAFGARPLTELANLQVQPLKSVAARFGQASYPSVDYAVGEHYAALLVAEFAAGEPGR